MKQDSQTTGKWWQEPWNFVYGCEPVGAGCLHCWAEANHKRWHSPCSGTAHLGVFSRPFEKVTVFPERLNMPLHWKKPRIVAVNLTGDTFHEKVSFEILDQAFAIMALCPQHTFIVFTKRWERMAEYFNEHVSEGIRGYWCGEFGFLANALLWQGRQDDEIPDNAPEWFKTAAAKMRQHYYPDLPERARNLGEASLACPWPLPNVHLGVSVSAQAELDAAMPHLLNTPAAVRLLSLEPLLEDLRLPLLKRAAWDMSAAALECGADAEATGIHGVIVGCESGPERRPCKVEWIESIVAQCKAAGVPVWVKQIDIGGRVSRDPFNPPPYQPWPESIRCRELPK